MVLRKATFAELDDLLFGDEYPEYIMTHGRNGDRVICNGDTLIAAQEAGYLWEEFLASKGLYEVAEEPLIKE